MEWNTAYKEGLFTLWENETPSPELVAMVAIQGCPDNKKALDIGCGAGREAVFLAQAGYDVIGVDISEEAIRIATERSTKLGLNICWKVGDALNIPVDSNSIDFLNDRGCFHIICEKEREAYAKEIYRVLKPGGAFLLRGCRKRMDMPTEGNALAEECPFKPITEETIHIFFPPSLYVQSPLFPISLVGQHDQIPGNLIYLIKR
jgi:ubiquinone/menaquinone biosynthesis C-methylase UbiE